MTTLTLHNYSAQHLDVYLPMTAPGSGVVYLQRVNVPAGTASAVVTDASGSKCTAAIAALTPYGVIADSGKPAGYQGISYVNA